MNKIVNHLSFFLIGFKNNKKKNLKQRKKPARKSKPPDFVENSMRCSQQNLSFLNTSAWDIFSFDSFCCIPRSWLRIIFQMKKITYFLCVSYFLLMSMWNVISVKYLVSCSRIIITIIDSKTT